MQRLETHLGFALFERSGRSATLNQAGKETLALAGELLALYARMSERGAAAGAGGTLDVGAIASAQVSMLPPALAHFRDAFPAWRVRLVPGVSLNLLGQVDAGEIDMAVIIRPPFALPAELTWRTLVTEPFVLLAPRAGGGGAPWRELLASEPFIRYDRRSFGGRQVERFLTRMRITVRDAIEADELQAIVELVARGLGVALVPRTAALGAWPKHVSALDLGEATFHREIGLVARASGERAEAASRLAECIGQAAHARSGTRRAARERSATKPTTKPAKDSTTKPATS
jgi:DNA-binding transcriptional LysR family regulator